MEAKALILEAYRIAKKKKGYNQSKWSTAAGHACSGQTVSRLISRGDCRISTLISLLDAIGCRLEIKEDRDEEEN